MSCAAENAFFAGVAFGPLVDFAHALLSGPQRDDACGILGIGTPLRPAVPNAFAAYEFIIGPVLENPQRVGKQLMAPLDDRHSARRGTYRVIYLIDERQMMVTVLAVKRVPQTLSANSDPSRELRSQIVLPSFVIAQSLRQPH